jgi:hypothetical protein
MADGTFGPIHFVRYNTGTAWNQDNTAYPFYQKAADRGFVEACDALLANKLITEQWRDEDAAAPLALPGNCSALSFFHRADGAVTGVCKGAYSAISRDEGKTWTRAVQAPTFITNNAKMWGQRTADNRYALVYNPVPFGVQRWPLAISTSADGVVFDTLNIVNGEVPQRRFLGHAKDFGSQYMRGIVEGNGDPRDGAMWVTYSMNKEDIWVSRIPVPVRDTVAPDSAGGDWNLYSPLWAPARVVDGGLELRDKDPYDYARAIRVFPESRSVRFSCKVLPRQMGAEGLEIELTDRYGSRPVRVVFAPDGWISAVNGGTAVRLRQFRPGTAYALEITLDSCASFSVAIDGQPVLKKAALAEAVLSVERISLRTGPYRNQPERKLDRYDPRLKDLPGADVPVAEAVFGVREVAVARP